MGVTSVFVRGSAILYMKVGTHAREKLTDIIARKQKEIDDEGMAMWGYGGNTCHPRTMVQPFARQYAAAGHPVVLAMQPMDSRHFAEQLRAEEYSVDGELWQPVPEPINVVGSRYALCIDSLDVVESRLDLSDTQVAVGNSRGKPGNSYVRGRVDKACLEVTNDQVRPTEASVRIGLVARLTEPYAVFLRN
jgi:hypothetical protein